MKVKSTKALAARSTDPLYIDTDGVGAYMMGPERW